MRVFFKDSSTFEFQRDELYGLEDVIGRNLVDIHTINMLYLFFLFRKYWWKSWPVHGFQSGEPNRTHLLLHSEMRPGQNQKDELKNALFFAISTFLCTISDLTFFVQNVAPITKNI